MNTGVKQKLPPVNLWNIPPLSGGQADETKEFDKALIDAGGDILGVITKTDELTTKTTATSTALKQGSKDATAYFGSVEEVEKALASTSKAAETSADKLTRLNRELIDNQDDTKEAKKQIADLEHQLELLKLFNQDDPFVSETVQKYTTELDNAKNKLSELQTQQT